MLLWKIQHAYNMLIQYVQHNLIQHNAILKILSEILQDSPEEITIIKFDWRIKPTQKYACIKQNPFCFQFSLRILQQHFVFQRSGKEKVKERQFVVKISPESLQESPSGIALFQFYLWINLNPKDSRIKWDLFWSQVSLRLLQQNFEFQQSGK